MTPSPLLEAKDLSLTIADQPVLQNISLILHPKQRLAILGPSGAGKTTLLRLLAGLAVPTAGTLHLGSHLASSPRKIHLLPEARRTAMIFQGLALFPHLPALEQIAFAVPPHLPRRDRHQRATTLLAQVGLGNRPTARMDELSGGERQRIAIARALAQQPSILLLDEPFASLDDLTRATMRHLLLTLLEETDTTLVLVTHQREDAFDLASDALILHQGQAVDQAPFPQLLAAPTCPTTVTTLALGDLLPAQQTSPFQAITPLGEITLTQPAPSPTFQILLRPTQLQINPSGSPNAEILSTHFTIPTTNAPTLIARCKLLSTEQILHTPLPLNTNLVPHQKVCLEIHGFCHPLS